MPVKGGLWLLLVACVTAYDNHDEAGIMDLKGDVIYLDDDGIDLESGQFLEDTPLKDMLMFKLINSHPHSDDEWPYYRPVFNAVIPQLPGWSQEPAEMDLKPEVNKRTPEDQTPARGTKVKPVPRYQPRWRIKRPPKLCLLKLCPSMYYSYE